MKNNCPRCDSALPEDGTKCAACGLSIGDEFAETAIQPEEYQDQTPTRLKEKQEQEQIHNTSDGFCRFLAGSVLADRYRIIILLGKGGMGEVYKAEDLKLDQTVALKFLPNELASNKEALTRFIGEVRNARQVSNENVCRVFDIGEVEGQQFISMEFIEGDDLSMLLKRIGRLPSDKAIEISRQICMGLNAIHKVGILHRDLKPANIIIDSNGKARITDFGIAGFEEDVQGDESRVGTPAYMSPEQLSGQEVTKKSDIYSLGLLLYEIFTGKQAFKGDSVSELAVKQSTTNPTTPSEHVENIDPAVEKLINRCLLKNPHDRPESAVHVALALPGGDPLQVALEAGETPSPEMVAAAPKKGALKPVVAFSLLLTLIAGFAISIYWNTKYKIYGFAPLEKSSEVLADRARSILNNLGYSDPPTDADYRFEKDLNYIEYQRENDIPPGSWEKLRHGQPLAMYFWYRQSPRYLEPTGEFYITETDPPMTVSGMVNVKLDTRGRLIELIAVPPQTDPGNQNIETNWAALFIEAGLDMSQFDETSSKWTPPNHSNARKAWKGAYADFPDIPIHIESASYNGKPVYFRIIAPWDKTIRDQEESVNVFLKAAGIGLIAAFILVLTGSVFLARHNLKVGRGDTKGASKLAILYFLVLFFAQFILANHIPTINGELKVLYEITSYSLIWTFFVFLIYIALEPFVRRWWSELLISWNRLLAGDFRDPMIGRDILIGGLCGTVGAVLIYLFRILKTVVISNREIEIGYDFKMNLFMGVAGTIGDLLGALPRSAVFGLMISLLLLLFYVIFRKKWVSILVVYIFYAGLTNLAFLLTTQHWWIMIPLGLIIPALVVFVFARYGLVAMISFALFFELSFQIPTTFDTTAFYFPNTFLVVATVAVLSIYAFSISIAGQSIFGKGLLEEN